MNLTEIVGKIQIILVIFTLPCDIEVKQIIVQL